MTQRNAHNAQPDFDNLPMISSHELARIINDHNLCKEPITNRAMMRRIKKALGDSQWAVLGREPWSVTHNPVVLFVFDEMMEKVIKDEADGVKTVCRERMSSRKWL